MFFIPVYCEQTNNQPTNHLVYLASFWGYCRLLLPSVSSPHYVTCMRDAIIANDLYIISRNRIDNTEILTVICRFWITGLLFQGPITELYGGNHLLIVVRIISKLSVDIVTLIISENVSKFRFFFSFSIAIQ